MLKLVAFDTETHLIQPSLLAPPLVCASYADGERACLLSPDEARFVFRELLASDAILAGANLPFDMGVMAADAQRRGEDLMPAVIDKYHRGEVHDILVAQSLDAIAGGHLFKDPRTGFGPLRDPETGEHVGRYSLSVCCDLVLGRRTAKVNDYWRERYAVLERVPMAEWPREARQYPVDDAVNTRDVALAQIAQPFRNLAGMARECRADLALHLGALWGLRVNKAWLDALAAEVEDRHEQHREAHAEFYKSGHKPGCLKRAKKRLPEDAPCVPDPDVDCVSGCDDGKEDGPKIRRRVAEAYGGSRTTTSTCPACGGAGKRRGPKGNLVNCSPRNFPGEVYCDGTGLDLGTAPGLPRTEGGGVSSSRDTLMESGDDQLMSFADDEFEKIRTTYVPFLRRGTEGPLCLSPNVLVSSFRTSYYGPIQQMPGQGKARAAFEARPGWVFSSCDYSGIELCTLAQVYLWLFGHSPMASVINSTGDPGALHDEFGARDILGISLEEFQRRKKLKEKFITDIRNLAKRCNFGLGGGMGAYKFVLTCRREATYVTGPDGKRYKGLRPCLIFGAERCGVEKVTEWRGRTGPPTCKACIEAVEPVCKRWVERWQMQRYFDYMAALEDGRAEVRLPLPGAVRGGVGFADGANGHFQGLAALLAKVALWQVTRECYWDRASPLFGTTRIPFFVHDDIFSETRLEVAHLTAPRVATIMVEAANVGFDWHPPVVPDVKVRVEPALSRRWLKAMESAYDDERKLIPWEDSAGGRKYLQEKGWEL